MASQMFSEFAHLQIPLEDVLKATDKFSDGKIIGKGDFGIVYKGKLKNSSGKSINISARRLDRRYGQGEVRFWTEVSVLSGLEHKNIVSMIGFCDEQGEKIIIHHRYTKGSLYKHLSNGNLTGDQRLKICQGVADAIDYLHNIPGKNYHIIHRNINSFTILLDRNWIPKLSGFEFSIKHSNDRMTQVFISEPVGTKGYIDPETDKTGGVTYKSDIYSLGVVLFEILCGRAAFNPDDHDNMYLVTLARSKFENKTISDLIHPNLQNQTLPMNSEAFEYLTKVAYYCTKEDRALRDTAHLVRVSVSTAMDMQKGKKVTSLEDLLKRSGKVKSKVATFKPKKVKKLEHLRISLEEIKLATNDFRKFPGFKSNESYVYYRGKLECVDREYLSGENVNTKDQLPKRTYDVEIKHIKNEEYMFDTEIEILGRCKHRNIESFLGFCDEGPGMILVFEFVSKRSGLKFHLHRPEFTWEKRLKVCIDIAHGLDYLQNEMDTQNMVLHRNITSRNIKVVYGIWDAYIAEFQHAVFMPRNQHDEAPQLNHNRAITYYTDPEYARTGKLKAESDVFSFGVVLFEILCGMDAHDIVSNEGRQDKRLEHVVGRWFKNGIIKNKVATSLKKENSENAFFQHSGLNKDSLDTFIAIAYQCLGEMQNQRPTIKVVIEELEKSLSFQRNHKTDTFRMSFEDIRLATGNFSNVIGVGGFGSVYIGELEQKHSYGHNAIVAKKLDTSHGQGHQQYYNELQILNKYRHENVIGLVGYSDETDEKLIVYERASKGSLDNYLNDAKLSWKKRLMICIDVASGIDFLHGGVEGQEVVIHRDIKTPNILLFDDWKAKLGDFGLSLISTIDKETEYTIDRACGTMGYVDPLYLKSGFLTIESDIYSLGVVLFEILSGRAAYKIPNLAGRSLLDFIRCNFEEGKQDEIVFKAIKEEIRPKSLTTFVDIVCKCLDDDRGKRPTSKEVLTQLKKALQIQVDEEEDIHKQVDEEEDIHKKVDEEEDIHKKVDEEEDIYKQVDEEEDIHKQVDEEEDIHKKVDEEEDIGGVWGSCSFLASAVSKRSKILAFAFLAFLAFKIVKSSSQKIHSNTKI